MKGVLAYTITRAPEGSERAKCAVEVIAGAIKKSGVDFDGDEHEWHHVWNWPVNRGQHYIFNLMLGMAHQQGFEWLLRADDDVEFLSQRWLAKILEAAQLLGPHFIISPTIKGLQHPPEMSQVVDVKGVPCRFLTQAIGGACRLHHVQTLVEGGYVSDVRKPLGAGDATGVMEWCKMSTAKGEGKYAVWLGHVNLKHATTKQVEEDSEYHADHGVLQRVPWIPEWPAHYTMVATPSLTGGAYLEMPVNYVEQQKQFNYRHGDGSIEGPLEGRWAHPVATMMRAYGDVGSVLDVGCRAGAGMETFMKEFPGARVAGVDIVDEFVQVAKEKGLEVQVADAHELPFADGEFDWVTCNGTFEHFYNSTKAAQELGRVASKGIYVTCDLRTIPLGSDYARSSDPGAWRIALAHTGMVVVDEKVAEGPTSKWVEFTLVRS